MGRLASMQQPLKLRLWLRLPRQVQLWHVGTVLLGGEPAKHQHASLGPGRGEETKPATSQSAHWAVRLRFSDVDGLEVASGFDLTAELPFALSGKRVREAAWCSRWIAAVSAVIGFKDVGQATSWYLISASAYMPKSKSVVRSIGGLIVVPPSLAASPCVVSSIQRFGTFTCGIFPESRLHARTCTSNAHAARRRARPAAFPLPPLEIRGIVWTHPHLQSREFAEVTQSPSNHSVIGHPPRIRWIQSGRNRAHRPASRCLAAILVPAMAWSPNVRCICLPSTCPRMYTRCHYLWTCACPPHAGRLKRATCSSCSLRARGAAGGVGSSHQFPPFYHFTRCMFLKRDPPQARALPMGDPPAPETEESGDGPRRVPTDSLAVRPSVIPTAGLGLFATRPFSEVPRLLCLQLPAHCSNSPS